MLRAVLTLCLMFLLFSACFGQQTGDSQEKVIFKANTEFPVQLETAFSTEKNNVGDDVNFILTEDVTGEGEKMLKGSNVYGRIVSIEKITPKNEAAKICIMFDFVKKDTDFLSLIAAIISLEPNSEGIKFSPSKVFSGGTMLSLKGKEIQIDKGRIFRLKLKNDITK